VLAQVSIEFISLISLLFILLLLVVYYNSNLHLQLTSIKILKDAQTICDQIASEINLALKAGDGYSRIFFIPPKLSGSIDYEISVKDYLVILSWKEGSTQSTILTKNITGEILKGRNFIKNVNGIIYANQ
jgi:thiamine monophosphate kinase